MIKHFRFASRSIFIAGILATGTMMVPNTAPADMVVYGDFRFRLESDWDSHKKDGITLREDRTRARIRARVGFNTQYNEWLSFGARLRSGSNDNHVSPHITILDFDDNDTGDSHFNLDKYFVKANYQGAWTWIGRNSLPFWKHNEMFWDDDATPVGIAAGYKLGVGSSEVALNTGYFSLPAGMQKFSGNLALGQLVFSTKFGNANKLTVSGGLLAFDANLEDKDATHPSLWDANGGRDYRIWIGSLQQQFKVGNFPLTLGVDVMHNDQDYADDELDQVCITDMADSSQDLCNRHFTRDNRDEDDGYVISVKLGQLKAKNDWLLGYYYAHIETFAVNSSYAQDDWGRWNPQASNMKGHELRAAYQFMKNANLVARFYSIEDITDAQDGKRFRLDFNFKF